MRHARALRYLAALAVVGGAIAFMPQATAAIHPQSDDVTTTSTDAHATVRDVNGVILGSVTIDVSNNKLIVTGRLSGLSVGFHGFHIHTTGRCDPNFVDPTGARVPFGSAGGHLNPGATNHGTHAGDLPSLLVNSDGRATAAVVTNSVTLSQIFDADGAAFIVHASPDNFANIPTRYTSSTTGLPGPDAATLATGDSGGRTACGVIVRG
jgi:superoxide dismutase, Cu-Zn family